MSWSHQALADVDRIGAVDGPCRDGMGRAPRRAVTTCGVWYWCQETRWRSAVLAFLGMETTNDWGFRSLPTCFISFCGAPESHVLPLSPCLDELVPQLEATDEACVDSLFMIQLAQGTEGLAGLPPLPAIFQCGGRLAICVAPQ